MTEPILPVARSDRTVPPVDLPRLSPLQREQEKQRRERERRRRAAARKPPRDGRSGIDVRV